MNCQWWFTSSVFRVNRVNKDHENESLISLFIGRIFRNRYKNGSKVWRHWTGDSPNWRTTFGSQTNLSRKRIRFDFVIQRSCLIFLIAERNKPSEETTRKWSDSRTNKPSSIAEISKFWSTCWSVQQFSQ